METSRGQAGRVAVLGTGAIGSAVAHRLLAAGHDVAVWNRTAHRTATLVAAGARTADSVQDAVRQAALTLVTVNDYSAVQECLGQLRGPLDGTTIVVLCTGTAADARRTSELVTHLGARYLDAGVQSPPESIGSGDGALLYAGARDAFEQHRETLGLLGPTPFVGEAPEAASVWDLALFGVWYDAQLGLLRALETVRAAGIELDVFADTALTSLGHVVAGVPDAVRELSTGDFPPGPASLAEHLTVVRHLVDLRARAALGDGGLTAVATRIEALVAEGRGAEGLTAIVG